MHQGDDNLWLVALDQETNFSSGCAEFIQDFIQGLIVDLNRIFIIRLTWLF